MDPGMNDAAKPTHLADFPGLVGEEFVGPWHKQSRERQEAFYRGTYLDLTYGDELGSEYPDGLVEGFQQLGMLDWLSAEVIGRWHGYNYGFDKIRFLYPLTVYQEIRLRLAVADVEPKGSGLRVHYRATLEALGVEKPVMAAEWIVLLLPMEGTA